MSDVGSKITSGTPSPFLILWSAEAFGRKSATAAAMITTSAVAACSSTARSISAAVSTLTTAALGGLDDVNAPLAEPRDVVLNRGVLPHLGVHGRAHDDRRARGQQCGREQVVGDAGRVLPEHASGTRCHHDEIGRLAEAGVGD